MLISGHALLSIKRTTLSIRTISINQSEKYRYFFDIPLLVDNQKNGKILRQPLRNFADS